MKRLVLGLLPLMILLSLVTRGQKQSLLVQDGLEGTYNRKSDEIRITGGRLNGREFASIENMMGELNKNGFSNDRLKKLKAIMKAEQGDELSPSGLSKEDAVLSIQPISSAEPDNVTFSVTRLEETSDGSLETVLNKASPKGGCEHISHGCVRCPDGSKYCYIKKLFARRAGGD